jgi:uncharacterized protein YjbI with pentapeptide repeats
MSGPDLRDVKLTGVNLTGAHLAGVNLSGANLDHANLREANLAHADLAGAKLSDASLQRSTTADLDAAISAAEGAFPAWRAPPVLHTCWRTTIISEVQQSLVGCDIMSV